MSPTWRAFSSYAQSQTSAPPSCQIRGGGNLFNQMKKDNADPPVGLDRLTRHSFPDYGVTVIATTASNEVGQWSHGQYGWYRKGEWGNREYPHDHIVRWSYLPNASLSHGDGGATPQHQKGRYRRLDPAPCSSSSESPTDS